MPGSPFLDKPRREWIASNDVAFAILDGFPVSPGHTLVVPHRLIAQWWDATPEERVGIMALVDEVKAMLDARVPTPDGYNVGFNAGRAAGQTVDHLHVHVIPRYLGDVPDPRGGIRHAVPGKGNYASSSTPALVDGQQSFLKLELIRVLRSEVFDRVDLLVSFIQRSGLELIDDRLVDILERDAVVRILTSDYLRITDPQALSRLLDLTESFPERLSVRVFHDDSTSFHPKAYLFWSTTGPEERGFVGSNNLSKSGIDGGVEWTVAVNTVGQMRASFDRLWADPRSVPLTHAWLHAYRALPRPNEVTATWGNAPEPRVQPVAPTDIQKEALAALERSRADGHRAGLVVMATGLGKTWLAAFDATRPMFPRVLFVAHREEILTQTRDVFRRVQPDADLGLFTGTDKASDAQVVFASVQTLSRRIGEFATDAFDYVVIDEFHHAAAASYRRIVDHFEPKFLLGLTATPERMDGADLLALCGDNLVYECNLVDGIRRDALVPFQYWGVRDTVDFDNIPWRNRRFDEKALTEAVETQERASRALEEWRSHGVGRTLAFCCSITHADFMADYFAEAGVRVAAVHTGRRSALRHDSLEKLAAGELDVVFSVDVFSEGVDVPQVEAVLMLRPTESPIIFLQQLGRGLRKAPGKDALRVVDFIGNHRSFLLKPRTLLGLSGGVASNAAIREAVVSGDFGLPDGCSVHYDLDSVDVLRELSRVSVAAALRGFCEAYAVEHGGRPSAIQALRAGFGPGAASAGGGWFALLDELGLLDDDEQSVVRRYGDVLRALEREPITKSYKLVTLRALLHDGALRSGRTVVAVSATSRRLIQSDPRLQADLPPTGPDLGRASGAQWAAYWKRWPLDHLCETKTQGALFRIDHDRFVPNFTVEADLGVTFDQLVGEIVDWRLARYLLGAIGAVRCKVSQTNGRPIIFLDLDRRDDLPRGKTDVLMDGTAYEADFVKIALNGVRPAVGQPNALPTILRRWFGPHAGQPGTSHAVLIERVSGTWTIRPDRSADDDVHSLASV